MPGAWGAAGAVGAASLGQLLGQEGQRLGYLFQSFNPPRHLPCPPNNNLSHAYGVKVNTPTKERGK